MFNISQNIRNSTLLYINVGYLFDGKLRALPLSMYTCTFLITFFGLFRKKHVSHVIHFLKD